MRATHRTAPHCTAPHRINVFRRSRDKGRVLPSGISMFI
jgi:hypothetical protein